MKGLKKNIYLYIFNTDNKYEYIRAKKSIGDKTDLIVGLTDLQGIIINEPDSYIAFYNTYDLWNNDKLDFVMDYIMENDADFIIHQYNQYVGFKSFTTPIMSGSETDSIVVYGGVGLSAVICKARAIKEIVNLLLDISKVYSYINSEIVKSEHVVQYINKVLSSHWSLIDRNVADYYNYKKLLFDSWREKKYIIKSNNLMLMCYEHYCNMFDDANDNEFLNSIQYDEGYVGMEAIYTELKSRVEVATKKAERQHEFYVFMRNWVNMYISGRTIKDKLRELEINNVGIYGYGTHGKMIMDELIKEGVMPDFVIDKNKQGERLGNIVIQGINNEIPNTDAIIVTLIDNFEEISKELRDKCNIRIINASELV